MTEILGRPSANHETSNQRASVSDGEVWTADLRPLVQAPPTWFDVVVRRAASLRQAGLVATGPVVALLEVLADSVWVDAPKPFVSSTDSGGVTAEFDTHSVHMSIDAEPGGELGAYVVVRGQWDWEGPLRSIPDGIEKWAWRLGVADREPN